MILGLILFAAIAISLMLGIIMFGWCVYLLLTHRARRALLILVVGTFGGVVSGAIYYLLGVFVFDTPRQFLLTPTLMFFGAGFAWVAFAAATLALVLPFVAKLLGQPNRWSQRGAKKRYSP